MAINSTSFGGVELSGEDARKFKNQVRYGKPKAAAADTVRDGVALAQELRKHGKVTIRLTRKAG